MALTVLNVAYPLAPVAAGTAGGAEQVVSMIDRALIDHGHHSLVVACEGSEVAGELIATPLPRDEYDDQSRTVVQRRCRDAIESVLAKRHVDLVHLHGYDFPQYAPQNGHDVLATLHLPLSWYPDVALQPRPRYHLNCVSETQRRSSPAAAAFPVVANGIDLDQFTPSDSHDEFALVIGRVCPEKGFHLAIDAAKAAGIPLVIAGEVFRYAFHQEYFRNEIAPRLDGQRVYIGPVSGDRKRELLARARCVLIPSLVDETSSLVAMEALASGTPVIAFRSGALPEVVDDGTTGLVIDQDAESLAAAIRRVDGISRQGCRRVAEERFSSKAMTGRYITLYQQLLAQ